MTVTLTLPMPPNMANGRVHWRAKDRARREYLTACTVIAALEKMPRPPAEPFARATVTAAMVLGNAMDDDNAMARLKWPIDWLVLRGYIADDCRKNLTWTGLPTQRVARKQPPSVTLTITATED